MSKGMKLKMETRVKTNINTVTIIGLGLIGGSIAKAIRSKTDIRTIIGIDPNDNVLRDAIEEGVISSGYNAFVPQINESDIIFLCTPVSHTLELIKSILPQLNKNCLITDVGSTKSQLIRDIDGIDGIDKNFHFVGGHPMAGSEKSGFSASSAHLFENAYYIITPCSKTSSKDLQTIKMLVEMLGGIPIELSPELHDKVTGAISHVPHIISAALVNLVEGLDSSNQYMQKLAAGGFKDITRISSSSPEMWHSICFSNGQAITEILDSYINILQSFKGHLAENKNDSIYNFFSSAKAYRDNMASKITGLIPGTYELIIDVVDKPGIIGEVATILGSNNINIKNINVTNSREFEGGVLIVTLPDSKSLQKAEQILSHNDYKIISRR